MGHLMLVLGGARSGKSTYAQQLAHTLGGDNVLFVATAQAGDADMAYRIAQHRQSRPTAWRTVEAPRHVGQAVRSHLGDAVTVLIDCMTLLVSNVVLSVGIPPDLGKAEAAMQDEIDALVQVCQASTATWIVVSNEVGLGLVPDTPLGRVYRDLLGRANQTLATHAQSVYFMVAGLAMDVKALASGSVTHTP